MNSKLKAKLLLGIMMLTPVFGVNKITPEVCASTPANVRVAVDRRELDRLLWGAIDAENVVEVQRLLHLGANPNSISIIHDGTALLVAVGKGNVGMVDALLNAGADVNGFSGGVTPLVLAVINNDLPVVNALLDAGADVNRRTIFDETAMGVALSGGRFDIIDVLRAHGANVDLA